MKWINNLNIKNKLLLGFAVLLVIVLIMISVAFVNLITIRDRQQELTTIEYPLSIELLKLRIDFNRERITIDRISLLMDPQVYQQSRYDLMDLDTSITATLDNIRKLAKIYPQIISGVQNIIAQRNTFRKYRDTLFHIYNTQQSYQKAKGLIAGAMFNLEEKIRDNIVRLNRISEENDGPLSRKAGNAFNSVIISFVVFGALLVFICIGLTLFFVNIIGKPIQELAKQAEQIAYGDLSIKINVRNGKDEVAVMQRSFGMMVSSLKSVSEELKSTVGTLDNLSSEIKSELNVGFNDTAAILRWVEKFSGNVSVVSKRLNSLMNEFKL